jgi:hypothetical protein
MPEGREVFREWKGFSRLLLLLFKTVQQVVRTVEEEDGETDYQHLN